MNHERHDQKHEGIPALRRLAGIGLLSLLGAAHSQTFTQPDKFASELLFSGEGTLSMQFDADGRLYICEKQGRILVSQPAAQGRYSPPVEFADYRAAVYNNGESGLLGMALDPDFKTNRYLYLFHTTAADQRIVRIQASPDFRTATPGTPTVILSGLPRNADFHKAGDIHIRSSEPDFIYLSLGDDGDENAARDLDRYHGKILKVRKTNGQGAPGNPFPTADTGSVRSRVWASGFRNPFRIVLHPTRNDILYAAENGGPVNQREREDRVSWVKKGADCAWSSDAYAAGATSAWYAPSDSKCKVLATDAPSLVGIALVRGSGFGDPANPADAYLYVSNLGYPNLGGYSLKGSLRRWKLSGEEWDRAEPVAADGGQRFLTGVHGVDLEAGPDGNLYCSSTHGDASTGGWYVFRRVVYKGGPVALASRRGDGFHRGGAAPERFDLSGKRIPPGSAARLRSQGVVILRNGQDKSLGLDGNVAEPVLPQVQ